MDEGLPAGKLSIGGVPVPYTGETVTSMTHPEILAAEREGVPQHDPERLRSAARGFAEAHDCLSTALAEHWDALTPAELLRAREALRFLDLLVGSLDG